MDGYKEHITEYPNFPKDGVNFKDLSPLIADEQLFRSAVVDMGRQVRNPKYWVGIDSRGFIFASALSLLFGGGVVCARKKGKTPGNNVQSIDYDLEYGSDTLELPEGSGEVVIVDDVLASGGTLRATNELAEKAGYTIVGNVVLVDLKYVPRVENFDINVKSVVKYV
jgi:adenine phosphoribosyltransferase|tara:strand:- start:1195 stop:1695 length:501 start_codon:yes stop_codon:yes gene_type:complete